LTSSRLNLTSHLLNLDNHEFGRLERREPHNDIDDTLIDVVLGGGLFVTFDKISILRSLPLKRPLAKKVMHEGTDIEPDLRPQGLIVRLKYDPLCTAKEAFFDEQGRTSDRDIFPLRGQAISPFQCPCPPDNSTNDRKSS
jgi:hypothetical protein